MTRRLRRWPDVVKEHGEADAFPGHGKRRDDKLTQREGELADVKAERDLLR